MGQFDVVFYFSLYVLSCKCNLFSQCEENVSLQDAGRYLKFPFSKGHLLGNNHPSVKTTKESFWITSFLCSTKLTQNGNGLLIKLLYH